MAVYEVTRNLPREETYGLQSQIRRAAISVSANFAEGAGRDTEADFGRFIAISLGSTNELETLLMLSQKLGFLDSQRMEIPYQSIISVRKQLIGLRKKLDLKKKAGR